MENYSNIRKNKLNLEKLYSPNTIQTTQSGYGFAKRRFRKEDPEKVYKKEKTTNGKKEEINLITTKDGISFGRDLMKLEEPKKVKRHPQNEEKNEGLQYSSYKKSYTTIETLMVDEKQKKESRKRTLYNKISGNLENVEIKNLKEFKEENIKKEETLYKKDYYGKFNIRNEQGKKEKCNKEETLYKTKYYMKYNKGNENEKKVNAKKEEISNKSNYKYNRGKEQEKKQIPKNEEKSLDISYKRQFKKEYFKVDNNQKNTNVELKHNISYYGRFGKKIYRQNTDNKIYDEETDNNEIRKNIFMHRRSYPKKNINEEANNNLKKSENVIIKKSVFRNKYNNLHRENFIQTSNITTLASTSGTNGPNTYASRRRILQQKEPKAEYKNNNNEINFKKQQEIYNYEDPFSTEITDQKLIEKSLNKLQKGNDIEKYHNMLLNYYPILSPSICQKHQIKKIKTEKETFFSIVNDLIIKFGNKKKNKNLKDDDLYEYVDNIMHRPAIEELKGLNIEIIPSRWNYIYLKIVKFEKETNDELIFYNLSNDLLNNIKNTARPFDIIYFLKEFMTNYYNKQKFNNNLCNTIKKFLYLGLTNCEYIDESIGSYLHTLKSIIGIDNQKISEKIVNDLLDPNNYYSGILHKIIIKFAQSKLAKSAFLKIYNYKEIPKELENFIFSDNIAKYIYYFPLSSYDNTERTLRRYPLILINTKKNKKLIIINNPVINSLLEKFVNIVVRKFIFAHEHQHLSGGLLFFSKKINRINTPPYNIIKGELIYNYNEKEKKGERGLLFELLGYGKEIRLFTFLYLLFIANENNDNLDIDTHCKNYIEYKKKKKDLLYELKNFPKNQILSDIIEELFNELLKNSKISKYFSTATIAFKKEEAPKTQEKIIKILENSKDIVDKEVCPLSRSQPKYKYYSNN